MEWAIEFDQAENYVRVTTSGEFSTSQHSELYEHILSREFWKPGLPLLFDNRKLDLSRITYEQVVTASNNYQKVADRLGHSKVAMLMGSLTNFGIGRQYQMVTENKGAAERQPFLVENDALDWILNK